MMADSMAVTESHVQNSLQNLEIETTTLFDLNRGCILIDTSSDFLFDPSSNLGNHAPSQNHFQEPQNILNYYVYNILMQTYEGEFLIAAHDFESNRENYQKLLDTKKRTYFDTHKIGKLVINHEFRRTKSLTIPANRFEQLAVFAAELFLGYSKDIFYTRSGQGKAASGVFFSFYIKQREKEIALGRLRNRVNLKRKGLAEELGSSDNLKKLKTRVDIIHDDYVKEWRETAFDERIVFYEQKNLHEIFETLPNLCNPSGCLLVYTDFQTFFKKPANSFSVNWPTIAKRIIKFSQSKKKDEEIKAILEENTPLKGEDHTQNLALILLPYLFRRMTKLTKKSKAKETWIPEKSEVSKSFITHIKDTANFQDSLSKANDEILQMYNSHKLPMQSYVVINGPSLSEINSACVILGNLKYQVSTPAKAVDLHFQCLKIFHKKFPLVCNHLYEFLEKTVYEFDVKQMYTGVHSLITTLDKF